jgi:hypothetical protein
MDLAWDMRATEEGNLHEYAHKWAAFQSRWVEMMPLVPLYSNYYYDFYITTLKNYNARAYRSWALAIPYAWIK